MPLGEQLRFDVTREYRVHIVGIGVSKSSTVVISAAAAESAALYIAFRSRSAVIYGAEPQEVRWDDEDGPSTTVSVSKIEMRRGIANRGDVVALANFIAERIDGTASSSSAQNSPKKRPEARAMAERRASSIQ